VLLFFCLNKKKEQMTFQLCISAKQYENCEGKSIDQLAYWHGE